MITKIKLSKLLVVVSGVLLFLFTISCGTTDGTSTNHNPTISLSADKNTVTANGKVIFTATVADVDNDMLTVTWSDNGGSLNQTTGLTVTWTAPSSGGTYNISATITDGHDGSATDSKYILVEKTQDKISPTNTSISINSGASSTSIKAVNLSLSATDNVGVTGYYATESSSAPSASDTGWTIIASTTSYSADIPFNLSSRDGTKTVFVWFKDEAGNISDAESDSIILSTVVNQPINVAGTWTWKEKLIEIISGACGSIGDVGTYSLTITQNGNQITFLFNNVEGVTNVSITGSITGNTISATGTITFNDGSTLQDTISLIASADGKNISGTLSQTTSSEYCTGIFQISATKLSGEEGWIKNPANGHYYKLTESMNWLQAEEQAVQYGGHLVTINDKEEELWLREQFGANEYFLIGFNDINIEGNWEWVNGESITYTNWWEGEPNDQSAEGETEDIAIMNWGGSEKIDGEWISYYGDGWNDVSGGYRGIIEVTSGFVNFSDYLPTDPEIYGVKTFEWTFGETGQYTNKIDGNITVPYKSGGITGVKVINSYGFYIIVYNDGISVKFLGFTDTENGDLLYLSTDNLLSSHPSCWSFSTLSNNMIVDESFYYVKNDLSSSGGPFNSKDLFKIQDVNIGGVNYKNAVIRWHINTDKLFKSINLQGKENLGIKLPTSSETGGYAISNFEIYGFGIGTIAEGNIASSSGFLERLSELISIAR